MDGWKLEAVFWSFGLFSGAFAISFREGKTPNWSRGSWKWPKRGAYYSKHWIVLQKNMNPGRLTWNLKITQLKRKIIFQTIIFRFHVNLPGCKPPSFHCQKLVGNIRQNLAHKLGCASSISREKSIRIQQKTKIWQVLNPRASCSFAHLFRVWKMAETFAKMNDPHLTSIALSNCPRNPTLPLLKPSLSTMYIPKKTNIEPENGPLEDEIPFLGTLIF